MLHSGLTQRHLSSAFKASASLLAGGDIGAMVSCILGARHSEHCRAIHVNYVPISFGFGMPSLSNPWHMASYLNAKLPLANFLPLFISREEMGYLASNTRFFERERGAAFCFASARPAYDGKTIISHTKNEV